jgi:HPC2 and ubinuclein domain
MSLFQITHNLDSSVTARPSSPSTKPASSAKPRSAKPAKSARSPSASPAPALPPVLFQTIRLQIRLGGPSNYEVDIVRHAKDTGQCPPTPPAVVKKVADSGSDSDDGDDKSKSKEKKVGKIARYSSHRYSVTNSIQKKNVVSEYYDTTDPFIDDSELAVDERQFFAQTKQQGFYVSSGEVALLKDKYVLK